LGAGLAVVAACAGAAAAAQGGKSDGAPSEVIFIAQIVVLLLAGRLLGEAMLRIGQPAVIGQLLAGILLGPSALGLIWPQAEQLLFPHAAGQKAMIDAVSQLGILLLLLLTGMETDLRLVRKVGRAAIGVSLAGISIPFVCGFTLGQFLPEQLLPAPDRRVITSLFLGTALAIASVKIVALVVRDMNFMRRNVGQVIIASAIIDDTIGWIVIAVTLSLAQHGSVDIPSVAQAVIGTLSFLAVSLTIGRRVVFALIRWTNDTFVSDFAVISVILAIMGVMALTTQAIGVHSVLGAFIAGILIGESPILTRHIDEQLRGLVVALFAPVFFGMAGLETDLTVLKNASLFWLMVIVIGIASLGKFAGAFIGGKLGGLSFRESLALGCGMNARGSTEVIVASIGASMGVISQDLFTVIVAMAVTTTMAMPPTLRWALSRVPIGAEERERLQQEEFEAQGFVTNLERLLVAVDESPNGAFASRLAGLIAGLRGLPATILKVGAGPDDPDKSEAEAGEQTIKEAAESAAKSEPAEDKTRDVNVITRAPEGPPQEAVAEEARKGYDMMIVGLDNAYTADGFDPEVSRLVREFEGPVTIALARGAHTDRVRHAKVNMLVPATGTQASRRAAEVALAIARASRCRVTALYVARSDRRDGKGRRYRGIGTRLEEQAILKDVVEMAERYQVPLRTAVRANLPPEQAILNEARRGDYNLIVMGVSRRPGEALYFGVTAEAVLARSENSILLVASGGASTAPEGKARQQTREKTCAKKAGAREDDADSSRSAAAKAQTRTPALGGARGRANPSRR
jgi:Kef-type K+ transport system membrane component KefB/nucleotide-binding universal stress UspA family protein